MIEQEPVRENDETTPPVEDVKERIAQAVHETPKSAFEHLKTWLQMPADSSFGKPMDKDCRVRAKDVGGLLSPGEGGLYTPSSLATSFGVQARWEAIEKELKAHRAVQVEGASSHVCGALSYFNGAEEIGFHVLVFLAVGADEKGRFYLGFDPDISATEEARAKWQELAPDQVKILDDTAQSTQMIEAMLLGESPHGFGPLIRKYYVDTSKPFPVIKRF